MYVVTFVSLFALVLTILDSRRMLRNGMFYGFLLLTIIGAIHYNYGNDYQSYYDIYQDVNDQSFDLNMVFSGEVFKEPGWALLCYLFKPIGGFFTMVALLNIFQNAIIYRMIKREVERQWWPFALSIYLFNNAFYLLSFSMMRQELVMCIFFGLWPLIKQRKVMLSLLILVLCVTIHTSSAILLPFAFWGYLPVKKSRVIVFILMMSFLFMWWQRDIINDVMSIMSVADNFSKYEEVYADSEESLSFGLGYLLNLIPLALSIYYILQQHKDENMTRMVIISSIGYLIAPLSAVVPLISRFSFYFGIYSIVSAYRLYTILKNEYLKYGFLLVFILMMLVGYVGFFSSPVYGEYYDTYNTIFSVIFKDWILYINLLLINLL